MFSILLETGLIIWTILYVSSANTFSFDCKPFQFWLVLNFVIWWQVKTIRYNIHAVWVDLEHSKDIKLNMTQIIEIVTDRIANIIGKEDNADYQIFQKEVSLLKVVLPFTTESRLLTTPTERSFENILGKGENAGNQHFLLFPQCFLSFTKQISYFQSRLFRCLHMLST